MEIRASFSRYLASKKSVDDRALNARVWERLARESAVLASRLGRPLRLLETGSGIGTMLERLLDAGLLSQAHITALDASGENSQAACQRLSAWGAAHGWQIQTCPAGVTLLRGEQFVQIEFVTGEVYAYLANRPDGQTWDLLVANAFLDLFHLPSITSVLARAISPGGLGYFSINFDGLTAFEPVWDAALDEQILALYHRTMDERVVDGRLSGDSRSGRHLIGGLRDAGLRLLEAGSSDWVVFAPEGCYPADEAYFLHFILHTVAQALYGHPELDGRAFADWLVERHAQVDRGELVYLAHQIDVLALQPGG